MDKACTELLYLCACALNGITPDRQRLDTIDPDRLWMAAEAHKLTALSGFALKAYPSDSRFQRWNQTIDQSVRRLLSFDIEREEICVQLENLGIRYMLLKGVVLKDLYPEYGMREMVDNDILIEQSGMEPMRKFLLKRGYEMEAFGGAIHDIFLKPPFFCIELHNTLAGNEHPAPMIAYYERVWDRLIPKEEGSLEYLFSDEDFYVYLIAHAWKHYMDAGIGLRVLADVYVYLREKGNAMNWDQIHRALEQMGINSFEKKLRELSILCLSSPDAFDQRMVSEQPDPLLEELADAGVFGSLDKKVENTLRSVGSSEGPIARNAKLRYYWLRLFPSLEWYKLKKPFLYRWKILIPFYCLYRLIWALVNKRDKIKSEIQIVNSLSSTDH